MRILIYALAFFLSYLTINAQPLLQKTYHGNGSDYGLSVKPTMDGGFIIAGETNSFGTGDYDCCLVKTDFGGNIIWAKTYGGSGYEGASDVVQTSDGGYAIVGFSTSFGDINGDVYVVRTDSTGDTLWTRTYGGPAADEGVSIEQSNDGGFIIAGSTRSYGVGWSDYYVIKINDLGGIVWTRTYGVSNGNFGHDIELTNDNGFIIAGATGIYAGLIKIDSLGNTLWTRTYFGGNSEQLFSVKQTSDGGYIATGWTTGFVGFYITYLIRTDSNGDTLWTRSYSGSTWDEGKDVVQMKDGNFLIIGQTADSLGLKKICLLKVDTTGKLLWTKTYGGKYGGYGLTIEPIPSGGYVIGGSTSSFGNNTLSLYLIQVDENGNNGCFQEQVYLDETNNSAVVGSGLTIGSGGTEKNTTTGVTDIGIISNSVCDTLLNYRLAYHKVLGQNGEGAHGMDKVSDSTFIISGFLGNDVLLLKIDILGNVLWSKVYGGSSGPEFANSVKKTTDGGFIIAGQTASFGAGDFDFYIIKTDSIGNLEWSKTCGGSDWEEAHDVRQTSDGGYIVVGLTTSFGAGGICMGSVPCRDVFLVKLDSSGNISWMRTYGGTGNDVGNAVLELPSGGYFVVGWTDLGPGPSDLYLIKTDSSGDTIWTKTYGAAVSGGDGYDIIQTGDGNYLLSGSISSDGLIKIDSNGTVIWTRNYGATVAYYGNLPILETNDGGFILVLDGSTSGGADVYMIRTDSLGDSLWTKGFGTGGKMFGVEQTKDMGFIMAGWTYGSTDGIYLIKTDSLGNSGCNEYPTNFNPVAQTLVISSGGIVTSVSPSSSTSPPTVVKDTMIANNELCLECDDIPEAALSYVDSGLVFSFSDASQNATFWQWDFGDGTIDTVQNPVHTYVNEGTYSVCIIISGPCGWDMFCDSVTVSSCVAPVAAFVSSISLLTVTFSNSSSNSTSWLWDFGDGNTDTAENPIHVYTDSGIYDICLKAINNCGEDSICQSISVTDTSIIDTTGINTTASNMQIKVYPNPNTGNFTIELVLSVVEGQISITNILGQSVYAETLKNVKGSYKKQIDLNEKVTGVYNLQLITDKEVINKKIIAKK